MALRECGVRVGQNRWSSLLLGRRYNTLVDVSSEHLLVIVLVSARRVSATIAWLHPMQGEKVVAHKVIDCQWSELSERGRRQVVAEAVRMASESAGVVPYSASIAMSDPSIASQLVTGFADLGEEMVLTVSEREQALHRARHHATNADREVLHAVPVHWTVRGSGGEREVTDPVGERGSRLTGHVLLITADDGYRERLASYLDTCTLHLDQVIAPPLALWHGMSSKLKKSGSSVVIDCGARHTAIIVSRRGRLLHIQTYPFGGDHLTEHLADQLAVSLEQAEELKRDVDCSVQGGSGENDGQQYLWREVQERHRLLAPAAKLCSEFLRQFFGDRARELREQEFIGQTGQIHLVGRGSTLGGLAGLVKDCFALPVVLGTGARDREPSAELTDLMISGVVRLAAEERRRELGRAPLSGRISRAWRWFTRPLE
jgi:cell division protein FtsA